MKFRGKAFVFGDHVNTDEIIPARYLSSSDPKELALHCMEDAREGFGQRDDLEGSVLVAGENFGCGSSREHAPISIKNAGISCVVAKSFARIFLRNSINIGLPIVELAQSDEISEEDLLDIDLNAGKVRNETTGKEYSAPVYPEFLQKIVEYGGWLTYASKELAENRVFENRVIEEVSDE